MNSRASGPALHRENDIQALEQALVAYAARLSDAPQMCDAIILAPSPLTRLDGLAADAHGNDDLAELRDLFDDIAGFGAAGSQATQRAMRARG